MIFISPYYLYLYNFLNKISFITCNFLLLENHVKKNGGQTRIKEELKDNAQMSKEV